MKFRPKRYFIFPTVAAIFFSYPHGLPAQPNVPTEYEVKAAFLYNFAKFVEWPPEAFKRSEDAFVIGILGDDPFGKDLEGAFNGKTVQDKKLIFKRLSDPQEAALCHVLFISSSEKKRLPVIINALQGPLLTVGDGDSFIQDGGMIGFIVEDNRVRFNINLIAAQNAGLKISSQLLKLAKIIKGKPAVENN